MAITPTSHTSHARAHVCMHNMHNMHMLYVHMEGGWHTYYSSWSCWHSISSGAAGACLPQRCDGRESPCVTRRISVAISVCHRFTRCSFKTDFVPCLQSFIPVYEPNRLVPSASLALLASCSWSCVLLLALAGR